MSARTIARAAGRMTLTTGRQHRCTSQTVGLHAVNFKRFNARRRAGWAGSKAIIWSTRRLPRVSPYNHNPLVSWYCGSCYNALGNADCLRSSESVVTTLLQHSSRKRRAASPLLLPPPSCLHRFAALKRPQDLHITLSTVEWKEGLNLSICYSQAATYAFFTNPARWKFPYENQIIL